MTDYTWPDDLVPYQQQFYLQPHVGGSESPFTRQSKIYALSAPRWLCRMVFRGGYDGTEAQGAYGPRLDAFLAKLEGRTNRVAIYDFRRTRMRGRDWNGAVTNLSAAKGDTSMTLTGFTPYGRASLAGDYLGGDGRPHISLDDVVADSAGHAVLSFKPALAADVGAGAALFGKPTGLFRLTSDDAGANLTEVGQAVIYTLDFAEDLS